MNDDPAIFEGESEGLAWRRIAGRGSRTLAVVFSQVRVPKGKFGLSRLFARTAHHGLFLNDLTGGWYRDQERVIDEAVDDAIKTLKPDRIVYYGSSMGGWGALVTALRRGDGKAVVFAPDLLVGEPGSRSAMAGLSPHPDEASLTKLVATGSKHHRHDLVFGLFDAYDAGTAASLAALDHPSINLVPVASTHEVHDHLYSINVIRRVISTFDRAIETEIASKGLLIENPDWPQLARLGALARQMASGERVTSIEIEALGLSGNPGAMELAARADLLSGDTSRAIHRLEKLVRRLHDEPDYATITKRSKKAPALMLLDLLRREGREKDMAALTQELALRYPEDGRFGPVSS
ncbi:hypothetical protein HDIA_4340 [Hartmannibacter diazotrophicus]|uniref:Alpha/beta hydrolase family protein n=1 Tax=Hartmannibacter diazotrophicus TaxID=1482074 RepID=A0A2C9DDP2_9HYPH|nr:hypothetical protein [Hartmannibacter diazotrophicus]SON57881.1 hypothetical protein HDIA_4340 [Hartmannibacter diazotrophicus]